MAFASDSELYRVTVPNIGRLRVITGERRIIERARAINETVDDFSSRDNVSTSYTNTIYRRIITTVEYRRAFSRDSWSIVKIVVRATKSRIFKNARNRKGDCTPERDIYFQYKYEPFFDNVANNETQTCIRLLTVRNRRRANYLFKPKTTTIRFYLRGYSSSMSNGSGVLYTDGHFFRQ